MRVVLHATDSQQLAAQQRALRRRSDAFAAIIGENAVQLDASIPNDIHLCHVENTQGQFEVYFAKKLQRRSDNNRLGLQLVHNDKGFFPVIKVVHDTSTQVDGCCPLPPAWPLMRAFSTSTQSKLKRDAIEPEESSDQLRTRAGSRASWSDASENMHQWAERLLAQELASVPESDWTTLQPGDEVIGIDGVPVPTLDQDQAAAGSTAANNVAADSAVRPHSGDAVLGEGGDSMGPGPDDTEMVDSTCATAVRGEVRTSADDIMGTVESCLEPWFSHSMEQHSSNPQLVRQRLSSKWKRDLVDHIQSTGQVRKVVFLVIRRRLKLPALNSECLNRELEAARTDRLATSIAARQSLERRIAALLGQDGGLYTSFRAKLQSLHVFRPLPSPQPVPPPAPHDRQCAPNLPVLPTTSATGALIEALSQTHNGVMIPMASAPMGSARALGYSRHRRPSQRTVHPFMELLRPMGRNALYGSTVPEQPAGVSYGIDSVYLPLPNDPGSDSVPASSSPSYLRIQPTAHSLRGAAITQLKSEPLRVMRGRPSLFPALSRSPLSPAFQRCPTALSLVTPGMNGPSVTPLRREHSARHLMRAKAVSGHRHCAAFMLVPDPTGQFLFSGADDGLVKMWDVNTAQLLATFRGLVGFVGDVVVNHDGSLVAASGVDDLNVIRVWRVHDQAPVAVLRGHTATVHCLAVSVCMVW